AGTTSAIVVYSFNGVALSFVTSVSPGLGTINSVNWSPDGQYLAAGTSGGTILVYSFNGVALSFVTSVAPGLGSITSINWLPDGQYLAAGTGGGTILVYSFNGVALSLFISIVPGLGAISSVNWSPDGQYLAVGTTSAILVYPVFPPLRNNIIKNNIVYCNVSNGSSDGIGISGVSFANLIIGNTAYQNDSNYQFVLNVYSGGVNGSPGLLQNVSIPPY
ncbi:MAG: WD40 repeat domain-containing protein, partial [Candidatus Babeliales bacterium]